MSRNNVGDMVVDIVSEISLSGTGVSLSKCSPSTVSRYKKAVNEYLEHNHMNWRVKGSYDKNTGTGYLELDK